MSNASVCLGNRDVGHTTEIGRMDARQPSPRAPSIHPLSTCGRTTHIRKGSIRPILAMLTAGGTPDGHIPHNLLTFG